MSKKSVKEKVSEFFKKIKYFILPILLFIAGFFAKIFVLDKLKKDVEEKGEVVKKELEEMKVEKDKLKKSKNEAKEQLKKSKENRKARDDSTKKYFPDL
jgi:F0F1-type ATP synthase membrane subunit b/b'